jgi:hypothetical protein
MNLADLAVFRNFDSKTKHLGHFFQLIFSPSILDGYFKNKTNQKVNREFLLICDDMVDSFIIKDFIESAFLFHQFNQKDSISMPIEEYLNKLNTNYRRSIRIDSDLTLQNPFDNEFLLKVVSHPFNSEANLSIKCDKFANEFADHENFIAKEPPTENSVVFFPQEKIQRDKMNIANINDRRRRVEKKEIFRIKLPRRTPSWIDLTNVHKNFGTEPLSDLRAIKLGPVNLKKKKFIEFLRMTGCIIIVLTFCILAGFLFTHFLHK